METKEYFAGTGSFSKEAEKRGHSINRLEFSEKFEAERHVDILNISDDDAKGVWFAWFSPPCTTFSPASLGHHWAGGECMYIPATLECCDGIKFLIKTLMIIKTSKPKYWVIENPRGVMRQLIEHIMFKPRGRSPKKAWFNKNEVYRSTAWYCQYGDKYRRAKPTDLWSNFPINARSCKNGNTCHEAAPRGAKTGTQGLPKHLRGALPPMLINEILDKAELSS